MNSICIELADFLFRLPANEVAWLHSEFNWGKCCPSSKWSKDPADVKAPPVTEAVTIGGKKRRDGFISSLLLLWTDHHKPSDLARSCYLTTLEVGGQTQGSPGWAKASASCMSFWKLLGRRVLSLLLCVVSEAQLLALETWVPVSLTVPPLELSPASRGHFVPWPVASFLHPQR